MLSELADTLPDTVGEAADTGEISAVIDAFLRTLPPFEAWVFMRRYFYADSVSAIAEQSGMSYRKITSMLYRMRKKLRARLEREGVVL